VDIVFECGAKSSDFREIVTVCMRVIDFWNNWEKNKVLFVLFLSIMNIIIFYTIQMTNGANSSLMSAQLIRVCDLCVILFS